MLKEINLKYKSLDLIIMGDYIKGRGYINRDDEPEEDEFIINEIEIDELAFDINLKMRDFILSGELLDENEIEQLCIEKCKE